MDAQILHIHHFMPQLFQEKAAGEYLAGTAAQKPQPQLRPGPGQARLAPIPRTRRMSPARLPLFGPQLRRGLWTRTRMR
jgi:hypothetical protein